MCLTKYYVISFIDFYSYKRPLLKQFFTIVILFYSSLLFAQKQGQAKIDSLLKEFTADSTQNKEDTNSVKLLTALSSAYVNIEPANGVKYGEQALALAEKSDWQKGLAMANGAIGINYFSRSDYPRSLDYALKSLKINEALGDKKSMASNLGNIANIYNNQENYPTALEYYTKALKMFEELNDKTDAAISLGNIGNTYLNLNNYPKTLEYSLKALSMCEETGNKHGIASDLGNISGAYSGMQNYPKALEYGLRAIAMFEELGDKNNLIANIGNVGECYLQMAVDTSITQIAIQKKENLRKAIDYFNKAIALANEIGDLDYLQTYSQNLSDAQELTGDYKDALASYKQHVIYNDSVFGRENKIKIINLEMKRDQDLKSLAQAKKHNERIFFIAGIVLLLLVIIFVFRNYSSQRNSNKLLSIEKKRSDDLLLNILPSEVADELKETGTAAAKYFDNVTVMFTDFVSFTKAGEKMTPQQLVDELHTCFKAFDAIIRKYKIEKIKTVGDAYLAVSGLPLADPEHAATMVKAALEINDFMRQRKAQVGDMTFEVRIGINSGNVVAGIVGVIKFAYDIWGDTVNTASRMEENSEAGKVNISQSTYELVKDKFHCTYRGEVTAKNKGNLKMYFVDEN